MLQIKNTLGGGKPEGMYVWKKSEIGSELNKINKSVSTLPYDFYEGCAVIYNGEIHILGGSGYYTKHEKCDGSSWVSVSTLPYNFVDGCAVVLNNEIHILGSYSYGCYTKHYKWDGTSWSSVSTLPFNLCYGSAVILNGEIHILGSNGSSTYKEHYKWNGSSWIQVSTLPYKFYNGCAVVIDGEIHILGTSSNSSHYKSHYKWDGGSWTSVSTLPYSYYYGSAVVFEGKIHIMGGDGSNTGHYIFDGTSWVSVNTLPYALQLGSAVVCEDGIHILGSNISGDRGKHYLIIGRVPVYTFLDYIVSDKETAYPDGGEKGGYYYEKVVERITPEMFGYTKMAIDKYTPTMDSYTNTLKVNHSLGIIPKRIFILVDMNDFQEDDSSNYLVFADIALSPNEKYMSSISRSSTFNMAKYPWLGGYSEGGVSTSYNTSWNITSKLFIFNTSGSFKYKAGTEYTIISMA